jgi:NAD(P)-dependent dehydrogenase (short-subunit alcohol dehydrogenase family)
MAGQKAKGAIAYSVAKKYLTKGRAWLAASRWQTNYDLTLALYVETTEIAFLCGNFEDVERWAEIVLQHVKTVLDSIIVYRVKIQADIAQNQPLHAVDTGLQILQQLEINFPKQLSHSDIRTELDIITSLLDKKTIEDLSRLPNMTEPEKLVAMQILSDITIAAKFAAPNLLLLITSKQVNLSILYGNASVSPFSYTIFRLILCGLIGDIESGYQFGRLALRLLSKSNTHSLKARTLFMAYEHVLHWKEHVKESLEPLLEIYQIGLETGDLEFAAYCAHCYCFQLYVVGKELAEVEYAMTTYNEAISRIKQKTALTWNQTFQQVIANLMGYSVNPIHLMGQFYNEEDELPKHKVANDGTAIFDAYFNKLYLCYLFSKYAQAIENSDVAEPYFIPIMGTPLGPLYYFYDALARLAIYPGSSTEVQAEIFKKVTVRQEEMKRWAHYAPMNYLHKYHLVEAEKARVLGQLLEAEKFYEQAQGHLDVVFANAGGGEIAPLGSITEEHFDKTFNTNVKGLLFTIQKALPLLPAGASIILNASTASTVGTPAFSVYSATKAAVRSFARNWILDLKERQIRVNAISPGVVPTPGYDRLGLSDEQLQEFVTSQANTIPLGRVGTPDEIAKAVVFLASDDSSFVNGIEMFVDGGMAQI